MRLIPILFIVAGVVLIYAAKFNKDPRNVVFEALGLDMRVDDPPPIGEGEPVGKWMPGTPINNPGETVTTV